MKNQEKTVKNKKKLRQGVVVSNSMVKTAVALVERRVKHPLYKKTIKLSKKFQFHDEDNKCKVGDEVKIVECKPISKHKRWRLLDITKQSI